MKNQESHDKAWKLMEQKGLTLTERMMVRTQFIEWSGYKEEYPFIATEHNGGGKGVDFYYSEYEEIKHFRFKTENEVILANALYVNLAGTEGYSLYNDFIQTFKYTCRVAGIKSDWV